MSTRITPKIDASDICERLVGITPVYLQNFIQHRPYRLRSSISPGKVRSQRRLFSLSDVYGIARLGTFWCGLCGDTIEQILIDVAGTKKADANKAAAKLLQNKTAFILVFRQAVVVFGKSIAKLGAIQRVKALTEEEFVRFLNNWPHESGQVIAVGEKFADVRDWKFSLM